MKPELFPKGPVIKYIIPVADPGPELRGEGLVLFFSLQ